VSALTPKKETNSMSRNRPVTRDVRVRRETVPAALNRLTGASVALPLGRPGPRAGVGKGTGL
jgi:hypothetical protein